MTTRVVTVVPTRMIAFFVKLRVVVLTVAETGFPVSRRLPPYITRVTGVQLNAIYSVMNSTYASHPMCLVTVL